MEEYHNHTLLKRGKTPQRYRGVSYIRPIDAAKEAVPVIDLADRLHLESGGTWERVGDKWRTNCVLPDHDDSDPSFYVYKKTNSWYCHGCHRGGDVVKLAQLAWGYTERESHIAAAELLLEYGHELPQRPPAYFRKQERQCQTRNAVEETKKNIVRRRLFKHLILPLIDTIGDEDERNEELERAWSDFRRLTA